MSVADMKIIFLVAIVSVSLNRACCQSFINCNFPDSELNALRSLYDAAGGINWSWTRTGGAQWNFTEPNPNPCYPTWQGITCGLSYRSCWVAGLDLSDYNLIGTVPGNISALFKITSLDLSNNYIVGTIPDGILNFTSLQYLALNGNQMSGTVPINVGYLTNLTELYLYENNLNGSIPESIGNCTALRYLSLEEVLEISTDW